LFQPRLQLSDACGPFEIECELALSDIGQVCMRVRETGHHRGARKIDLLRVAGRTAACFGSAADEHDASSGRDDRFRTRLPFVPGMNSGVREQQRSRLRGGCHE
jgi:hypothetical protein